MSTSTYARGSFGREPPEPSRAASGPGGAVAPIGPDVVVTGVGMRTAVGNDAVQTCATIRTSLSRFIEWPYMAIGVEEAGIVGAALVPDLGDASWQEKWFGLTRQASHEALWQAQLFDGKAWRKRFGETAKIGVWIAAPGPREDIEPEVRAEFEQALPRFCIDPATADVMEIIPLGHAAGLVAVGRAANALAEGQVKVAIVIGVESNLSSPWLEKLDDEGVLKHSMRNIGLIPGDAGGVVVLERRQDASRRGAEPLLSIGPVVVGREEIPIGPEHPILAKGLGDVVRRCLRGRADGVDVRRVLVDHNGQRWRALEWGLVETRCLSKVPKGWKLWHPADSFGDVGAASGVLALGIAARAYARGYGGDGSMLVTSVSPSGERAAVIITPGPPKRSPALPGASDASARRASWK